MRQPGQVSNYEQTLYLKAVFSLTQSREGRRKIVDMTRRLVDRAQQVAKVYRENIGTPDLYEKLAELDTPMFSDEDRKLLEGVSGQEAGHGMPPAATAHARGVQAVPLAGALEAGRE